MTDMTDRTHEPDNFEISAFVSNPAFDTMCNIMTERYGASRECAYSGDSNLPGWNVRFYKSGRTLCRLYPKAGYFSVLVVVGRREKECVETVLPDMSAQMRAIYEKTCEGMGQRWLMIDIDRYGALFDDVFRLVSIRIG